MVRKPMAAGSFYPELPDKLTKIVESMTDKTAAQEEVLGLVCPHAGYEYSGEVAGATISRVRLTDTVIMLGTNHTGLGPPFSIMTSGMWETPLGYVDVDTELAAKLLENSSYLVEDIQAHLREHSIEVQLPFLQHLKKDIKIVPIVLAQSAASVYKAIGDEIADVINDMGREVVLLASSDMTHYESQQQVQAKDDYALQAILKLDVDDLLGRLAKQNITMCGVAPVAVLMATVKSLGAQRSELVSYKTSGDASGDCSSVVGYAGVIIPHTRMSPLVKLAHKAIAAYVEEGRIIPVPTNLIPEMRAQAGVFVSLHKGRELRGCIGTFEPSQRNVAEEIIMNAVSAATHDQRFETVKAKELKDLDISVDVLTDIEEIDSKDQLDPRRYGVIVARGIRRGLLLPDLDGVDTPEQQIAICRRKADIGHDEMVRLYRFEVKRYH